MTEKKSQHIKDKRLYRSTIDKMIGGVCGGFAEYFRIDVTLVRVFWLIVTILGGFLFGILAYLACLFVMKENPSHDASTPKKQQNASMLIGVSLILVGLAIFSSNFNWNLFHFYPIHWHMFQPFFVGWSRLWPVLIILIGMVYIYHIIKNDKTSNEKSLVPETKSTNSTKKFIRSKTEKIFGGVCSGLADYLNIDPVLVRILWIIITVISGIVFGVILYIILLIIVPDEDMAKQHVATSKIDETQLKSTSPKTQQPKNDKKE